MKTDTAMDLVRKWRAERAHTYASENADHYRGFEAGCVRAADELEAWAKRMDTMADSTQLQRDSRDQFWAGLVVRDILGTLEEK